MAVPEGVQQLFIGNPRRIVIDLNRLRVIPKIVIGGVLLRSSGISNAGANDTRDAPEPGVGTPESAERKGRRFCFQKPGAINGRNHPVRHRLCFSRNIDLLLLRSRFATPLKEETKSQNERKSSCQKGPLAEFKNILNIHSNPPFRLYLLIPRAVNNSQRGRG